MRQPVGNLVVFLVQGRKFLRFASTIADRSQAGIPDPAVDNGPILAPAEPFGTKIQNTGGIDLLNQHHWRSPGNSGLLDLPIREKCDRLTIRREARPVRTFGPRDFNSVPTIEVPHVDASLTVLA